MLIIKHFTKIQHPEAKVKYFAIYLLQKRQLFSSIIHFAFLIIHSSGGTYSPIFVMLALCPKYTSPVSPLRCFATITIPSPSEGYLLLRSVGIP